VLNGCGEQRLSRTRAHAISSPGQVVGVRAEAAILRDLLV